MVKQTTKQKRSTRPAPVKRITVTVKGKPYECLVHLYNPFAPVLVASASQAGFWQLEREDGLFVCACPAFDFRQTCAHVTAALLADAETAESVREHRRPPHLDAAEYGAWLDEVIETMGNEPPDDDGDGWDGIMEEWADGTAAHRGLDWR